MKRGLLAGIILIFCLSIIAAQDYKVEVSPTQEAFGAGENITLKLSLLDSGNNPINDDVLVTIKNTDYARVIKKTLPSNTLVEVELEEGGTSGFWTIEAVYNEIKTTSFFMVETNELAKFKLVGETLTVTNIGNSDYTKTIQIIIGDTIGTRNPNLKVGESISYKLVAPDGLYNVKITDGLTTLHRKEVKLAGTGQAIGALDERASQRSPLTGGISPDEEDDMALLSYMKKSQFVYVFIFVIIGAFILLAIERKYLKKENIKPIFPYFS